MDVNFTSDLPFGINIDKILGTVIGTDGYYENVVNEDIKIKIGRGRFEDFPISSIQVGDNDGNPDTSPSSKISGVFTTTLRQSSPGSSLYYSDDVTIRITVKLTRPADGSPIELHRIDSKLNYQVPSETFIKITNADNDVYFAVPQLDPVVSPAREVVLPPATAGATPEPVFQLGGTAGISYSLSGELPLSVPVIPTSLPTPSPTPMPQKKEIIYVLDSSMGLGLGESPMNPVLNYVLYSLTNLEIKGMSNKIDGSLYTNQLFHSTTDELEITGGTIQCRSKFITGRDNVRSYIESKITDATQSLSYKDLEIWPEIQNRAEEVMVNAGTKDLSPNVFVRKDNVGEYGLPTFNIYGSGTLVLENDMYFKGNLTISLNNIVGNGDVFILAEGDILIQGQDVAANKEYDRLNLYSKNGNIKFQSDNTKLSGLSVAPMKDIIFQGGG